MLEEFLGQVTVADLRGGFVCIGTLHRVDDHFVELLNADFHDLHDTQTTRELYISDTRATGVKRTRRQVLLVRAEIIALSRLEDIVSE